MVIITALSVSPEAAFGSTTSFAIAADGAITALAKAYAAVVDMPKATALLSSWRRVRPPLL